MKINLPVTDVEVELDEGSTIVSRTDLKGVITYVNGEFVRISGYSEAELLGASHNIVRHPDMPKEGFEDLWRDLKAGRPWSGLVKNRCKNGNFYWVHAQATPVLENGQVTGYMSVRRRPARDQVALAEALYRDIREGRAKHLRVLHGQAVPAGRWHRAVAWVRNLSVKARLGAVLGLMAVVLVVQGGIGLAVISADNNTLNGVYERRLVPIHSLGRINALMSDNRAQILLGMQHDPSNPSSKLHDHPLTAHSDAIVKNAAEITALWEEYIKPIGSDEHKKLAREYEKARKRYVQEGLLPARQALLDGRFADATGILLEKVNPAYHEVIARSDALVKFNTGKARAQYEWQMELFHWIRALTIGGVLAVVLGGMALGMALMRSITRPLAAAREIFQGIGSGNYRNDVDVSHDDEIGKVMQGLQSMQVRLGCDVEQARRVAAENLRIRVGLDNVATNVMIADHAGYIIYLNNAIRGMFAEVQDDIRKELPQFDAERLVGTCIDTFHRDPRHQQQMLEKLRGSHRATLRLGGRTFALTVTPVVDGRGERLGTAVEWVDRSAEVATEDEVTAMVEAAMQGDLSHRLPEEGKSGFFLELARGLNHVMGTTASAVQEVGQALNALARGDLAHSVESNYGGTFGQLKDDTNATVSRLREVVGRIKESTDAINTASGEIASGNQDLSSRTEEQASSLQEAASSMEELNATV
ncbi:MAG: Tar ligand binding domain-containing protein, partial [Betaproteobacteria bacterium]|nr:Tar ligand binding domain-containing protein [Betaproteobacteria bacterium]